jgi:hypothetical protein
VETEYTEYTIEEEEGEEQQTLLVHPEEEQEDDSDHDVSSDEGSSSYYDEQADRSERSSDDEDDVIYDAHHEDDGEEHLEEILRNHRQQIKLLMESNKEKDFKLEQLEQQLHHQKVQQKEGIYWLQLQLDTARREKDAAEERMVELQADLKHMLQVEGEEKNIEEDKLQKYQVSMDIMENQMTMLKTSCGEIIKTLKEEIADLMDDRSRMELDLLNQLSVLDNEKRRAEFEHGLQIKMKEEIIERLQAQGSFKLPKSTDSDDFAEEVDQLRMEKRNLEHTIKRDKSETEEALHRLEEEKAKLERLLEAAKDDLAVLRSGPNSQETVEVLDRITQEREAINSSLIRVTTVWELADASIQRLENGMDQLRPRDDTDVSGDRGKILSTLESASLVHGQVKVSLLFIELKLRNQLQCLKNDKLSMGWAAPSDQDIASKMEEIQKDALTALKQVEESLSDQMRQLEKSALSEVSKMKDVLRDRVQKLVEIQEEYKELEAEVSQLKNSNQDSDCYVGAAASHDEKSSQNPTLSVSSTVMNQLHTEVLRIVERIQAKNETIASLRSELDEHRSREQNLRKELKRALRANTAGAAKGAVTRKAPNRTQSEGSTRPRTKIQAAVARVELAAKTVKAEQKKQQFGSPVPLTSPTKTPVKTKDIMSPANSNGQRALISSPVLTPTSGIRPLQPSPREITKPRFSALSSPPFKKSALSPLRSPTGVTGVFEAGM